MWAHGSAVSLFMLCALYIAGGKSREYIRARAHVELVTWLHDWSIDIPDSER